MFKQLDGYNAKKEKLLLDKSPNKPGEVPKLIKLSEVPKQVNEAELDAIGYNACKKRTDKLLDRVEVNAVS